MSGDILEKFANAALDGVLAKAGDAAWDSIFGSETTRMDLSEQSYKRIKDIVRDAIKEADLITLKNSTRSVLDLLFNSLTEKIDLENTVLPKALDVRNQIAGITETGYLASIPYWTAAAALLCVHMRIYEKEMSANTAGNEGAGDQRPSSINIAVCAFDILEDLLNYEEQMRKREGLDVFSTFKLYSFWEDPYDDLEASPLSYMGKHYRENVQKLLGIIQKYDPNNNHDDPKKRLLNQMPRRKYVLKFFDFANVSDKVMHAWDSGQCFDRADADGWPCKFWMCFPIAEYQPLGDLCIANGENYYANDRVPKRVPYIRAVGEGKLAYPADYQRKWKDKDSQNPVDLSAWEPLPPDGFAPVAFVINQSESDKPSGQRCVVVQKDDVDLKEPGDRFWTSRYVQSEEDGALWRHPEGSFGDAGLFAMGRTLDSKPTETPLAKFKQSALAGHPELGVPPAPPNFDPGNWTATAGAFGTSQRWQKSYKVRYRIGFYSPLLGTIVGAWWHPTYGGGADADGYYDGSPWACPTITNISTDPSGTAVARIVYRQFFGWLPEVVGVITDNKETRFLDQVDMPTYGPPATAPTFDPANWAKGLPVSESTNWQPGYKVRYAVSFYNSEGETAMGPWWSPNLWPGMDSDGFFHGGDWACPALVHIPVDPTGTAIGRRIYRQFRRGGDNCRIELVHDLKDNQTTMHSDLNP